MELPANFWRSNRRAMAAQRGQETQRSQRSRLAALPVRLPVRTMRDARSDATLAYCLSRLREGGRWDVLRRELGCGPSHKDKKWREVKRRSIEALHRQEIESYLAGPFLQEQIETTRLVHELDRLSHRINVTQNIARFLRLSRLWLHHAQKVSRLGDARLERLFRLAELKKRDHARWGQSLLFGAGSKPSHRF